MKRMSTRLWLTKKMHKIAPAHSIRRKKPGLPYPILRRGVCYTESYQYYTTAFPNTDSVSFINSWCVTGYATKSTTTTAGTLDGHLSKEQSLNTEKMNNLHANIFLKISYCCNDNGIAPSTNESLQVWELKIDSFVNYYKSKTWENLKVCCMYMCDLLLLFVKSISIFLAMFVIF